MTKLDVGAAISAHKWWKTRLSLLIDDSKREQLDPIEVGDHARCDLGKWLAMAGDTLCNDPLYPSLVTTHIEFHRIASAIASLANNEQIAEAKVLLDNEFSELSADVVDLLNEILIRDRKTDS
jgi:hypothetical protein